MAGLLLVFALWWSYFKHSATEHIRQSLPWTFVWALGHYLVAVGELPPRVASKLDAFLARNPSYSPESAFKEFSS